MKKVSRRDFLKSGICFGASLVCADLMAGSVFAEKPMIGPSLIGIGRGMDINKITKDAISLIGGMEKVVKPGQKVFIKPNYIAGGFMGHDPVTSGEIPHPEVIQAVVNECLKAGAKEVVIGEWFERPLDILWQGKEGKEGAQIKERVDLLNKKFGQRVFLVNLRNHTKHFKYIPSLTKLGKLAIPNLVAEADAVISIAVLKTHHRPISVTLGMKNFIGIMPSVLYGEPRMKLHEAGINQVIIDINKAIRPKLTVISGVYGMEGEGVVTSFGGISVDVSKKIGSYLVIAGMDSLATDATAARIITDNWQPQPFNNNLGVPWYIEHLRCGFQQGLGQIEKSKIIVKGCNLTDISMSWEMPKQKVYPELPNHVK
ncbi:MAG: DUF362 domain-containing protein [Candidatus Omnitrophica bacterium]|nr:DUF362 domain-containing protein [Candidatus Omnitrophota bacterium]